MTFKGTTQRVQTNLSLGIQFDEFDFRLFLRDYHRDLRNRFPSESFPAYSPSIVLNSLVTRFEKGCGDGRAGRRYEALQRYARRAHRLDLSLTGSDYGPLEKRLSPYDFDRSFYHLGRCLVSAQINMEPPGYNPYRSTRRISIDFMRDHFDDVLEFLPDYLWWSIHDQRDIITNILVPEQLEKIRRLIELAGFKLDTFGLYLTTHETLWVPETDDDEKTSERALELTNSH